jgi:UDP-N-acetylmuramate--alanine ligase
MEEFATAFSDADSIFVLDIYAASEKPIDGVTAETLAGAIAAKGKRTAVHIPSFVDASAAVAALAQPGDMILTLGAGNVSQLGPIILERLNQKLLVDKSLAQ